VSASTPQVARRGVLVTGGGRRVGRAIAAGLAADGWFVCIHCHRSDADAADLLAEVRAAGGDGAVLRADLADIAAVEGLMAAAHAASGGVTCLVNNASLFDYDDLATMTAEGWDRHMAINLRAPALLARDFARSLPVGEAGCIVNLLDQKLWNQNPDFLSYTISKAGLRALTEVLAIELAPRIRVCGIAPGLLLPSGKMSQASFERAHRATPLGFGPTVAEVVTAVRFILAVPSFNGQTIAVDGGESLMRREQDVQFDAGVR